MAAVIKSIRETVKSYNDQIDIPLSMLGNMEDKSRFYWRLEPLRQHEHHHRNQAGG
jgi:hypothetical protein